MDQSAPSRSKQPAHIRKHDWHARTAAGKHTGLHQQCSTAAAAATTTNTTAAPSTTVSVGHTGAHSDARCRIWRHATLRAPTSLKLSLTRGSGCETCPCGLAVHYQFNIHGSQALSHTLFELPKIPPTSRQYARGFVHAPRPSWSSPLLLYDGGLS